MKKIDLNFHFKGGRQYVHGTDIFNECVRRISAEAESGLESLEFAIHRMTSSNLLLTVSEGVRLPVAAAENVASLKFVSDGKKWLANLAETGEQPHGHYPYDENIIFSQCHVDVPERVVTFDGNELPYSAMEIMVSMTKALHLAVFPQLSGRWVFCRWASAKWPLDGVLNGTSIQLVQTLGTRLTKSDILRDGRVVGQIYFSARDEA